MTKTEALALIDARKNSRDIINPVELLAWTWLRVIVLKIPADDWEKYVSEATEVLSR